MRHVIAVVVVTLGAALQLAACSPRITTLEGSRKLSSLTVDEQRKLCDDHARFLTTEVSSDALRKVECATRADLAAQLCEPDKKRAKDACKQAFDACLRTRAPELHIACKSFPERAKSCAVTVNELSTCRVEQAGAFAELAERADKTCDRVGRSADKDRLAPPETDMCEKVSRACPRLLDEEEPEAMPAL